MENITQKIRKTLGQQMSLILIEDNPNWRISAIESERLLSQLRRELGNHVLELNRLVTRADLMDKEYTLTL